MPRGKAKHRNQYIMYKNEDIIALGTVPEIAKTLNLSEKTIWFYASPANLRRSKPSKKGNRRQLFLIKDDED